MRDGGSARTRASGREKVVVGKSPIVSLLLPLDLLPRFPTDQKAEVKGIRQMQLVGVAKVFPVSPAEANINAEKVENMCRGWADGKSPAGEPQYEPFVWVLPASHIHQSYTSNSLLLLSSPGIRTQINKQLDSLSHQASAGG